MQPTITDFMAIFKEFSCESSTRINFFFNEVMGRVCEDLFCSENVYVSAVYYMLAHELTMADPERAKTSMIKREKAGDVEYEYSETGSNDAYFGQTQYGKKYLRLLKENVISVHVL